MTPCFSDADMNRLKNKPHNPHEDRAQITHSDLMSLLARLEAGERYISYLDPKVCIDPEGNELLLAWRKSCGR